MWLGFIRTRREKGSRDLTRGTEREEVLVAAVGGIGEEDVLGFGEEVLAGSY